MREIKRERVSEREREREVEKRTRNGLTNLKQRFIRRIQDPISDIPATKKTTEPFLLMLLD